VLARGAEELWTLPPARAQHRVAACRRALDDAGLSARGFVPPGFLASPAAVAAVAAEDFEYLAGQRAVINLSTDSVVRAVALGQRPDSPLARVGAISLRPAMRASAHFGGVVRVGLHPSDLDDRRLVRSSLDGVLAALDDGAVATTYSGLLSLPVSA
jgi:uncharacterized protein